MASFGGADLFKILHTLIQPKKIKDFKYNELIIKLEEHFAPKKNEIAESFKFYKREQNHGETITEYIVELKSLAQNCNFGEFLDRALRDRFICGILNESIQQKLFNDNTAKEFDNVCEIALMMEATKNNLELIHSGTVNFVERRENWHRTKPTMDKNTKYGQRFNGDESNKAYKGSNSCHQNNDSTEDRRITCYFCGLPGHISRFCFKRKQNKQDKYNNFDNEKSFKKNSVNNLKENENLESKFNFQYINVISSDNNRTVKGALTTLVDIDGHLIRMEIDTGASGTVIHIERYREIFPKRNFNRSEKTFSLLSGESVSVVGCDTVLVEHNGKKYHLEFTIVNGASNVLPLLGQDWLDILYPGWREFFIFYNDDTFSFWCGISTSNFSK